MSKPLRLTVLTPAETLLEVEEVAWVQVRLADGGGMGIYPGHAPLLAETVTATLRYADPWGEHALEVEAGVLQVDGDGVTILTSGVVQTSEVCETSEVLEGARFDRLAQALVSILEAQPVEVLDVDGEEA
jgi:F0F1-type ATP synthase epsilon subunit